MDYLETVFDNPTIGGEYEPGDLSETKSGHSDEFHFISDSKWSRSSFLIQDVTQLSGVDRYMLGRTSADETFADSRIGGQRCLNPKPQYTRTCDMRRPGRAIERRNTQTTLGVSKTPLGMGRIYHKHEVKSGQYVYMRFGTMQFNSLTGFLGSYSDRDTRILAATGKGTSAIYNVSYTVGSILRTWAKPLISAAVYSLKFLFGEGKKINRTSYFTIDPQMELLWNACSVMIHTIMVNKKMLPDAFQYEGDADKFSKDYALDLQVLNDLAPGLISATNGIDVAAVANRYQRLSNRKLTNDVALLRELNKSDKTNKDARSFAIKYLSSNRGYFQYDEGKSPVTSSQLIGIRANSDYYRVDVPEDGKEVQVTSFMPDAISTKQEDTGIDSGSTEFTISDIGRISPEGISDEALKKTRSLYNESMEASYQQGSEWVCYRVNPTGTVTDTFSNTVKDSALAEKVNSAASGVRSINFSMAGGNIVGGEIGAALGAAAKGIIDIGSGLIGGITFGLSESLSSVLSGAVMHGPKSWDSSTVSLATTNYEFDLVSYSAHPFAQLQNIFLPMAPLICGTLPLATGPHSHTSPLLCQFMDPGRSAGSVNIISRLSVERGIGNLPYNNLNNALAYKVSFSITNLDPIVAVPVTGGNYASTGVNGSTTNMFDTYLKTLSGLGFEDQLYNLPMALRHAALRSRLAAQATSGAAIAHMIDDSSSTLGAIQWLMSDKSNSGFFESLFNSGTEVR